MIAAPLALLLALAAAPEMDRPPPAPRAPAPATSASTEAGTNAPAPTDAELQERIDSYLGAIDTPVTGAHGQALGPRAVPVLESVVRDPTALPSRRARAVEALSQIGGARAEKVVLDVARSEAEPFGVRAVALRAAPRLLSTKDLSTELRPVLEGAREAPVRATAAEVLAERGGQAGCAAVRAQLDRESGHARAQFNGAAERCNLQKR